MKSLPNVTHPTMFVLLAAAMVGCSAAEPKNSQVSGASPQGAIGDSAAGETARRSALASRASGLRPADHVGRIPVLEYHLIGQRESRWGRTPETFRKDLELLYERGYRPITVAQLLARDFADVPAGMSPVVFTFDDASPGQFSYIERNGRLEIDPQSAVGIWMDFAQRHPDWKGRATFCMLNGGEHGHNFFGDKERFYGQKREWRFLKVKWLADNGFELCNHTLWHAKLSRYPDAMVQEQIARNSMGIDSAVSGYRIRTFALPLGLWPKNRSLAWSGSWTEPRSGKVVKYDFDAVLEVSGGPTRSPYDPRFNPKSINRVEVFGDELQKTLDQLDRSGKRFVK